MNHQPDFEKDLELRYQQLEREIIKLKKEKAQFRSTRIKSSVVLLVLLLFSMVTTTFSWFTISGMSSVEHMDIKIGTGVQLMISDQDHGNDISAYKSAVTNEDINRYLATFNTSLDDTVLDPLTSENGIDLFTQGGVKKNANDETFLEFPLYFIASEDMWVHLTTNESEDGKEDQTKVSTTSTGIQADIVNCVRVSFTDEQGNSAIYEPNKGTAVAGQTTFDLSTPMSFSDSTRLFHLDALTSKKIIVRVWIEGEDPECDNDVQRANLQMQFNFQGTDENNVPMS